jgi:hypothetical protein
VGAPPLTEPFDPQISELIKAKARKLCRSCPGFTRSDEEDVQQELSLQLVRALPKHDATRAGFATFVNHVIENGLRSLARHASAAKRDRRRERPLHDVHVQGGEVYARRDLAIDVHEVVSRMPAELRAAAALFMEQGHVAAVTRHTGLTRAQVRRLRRHVAHHLRESGLAPNSARPAAIPRRDRVYDQRRHAA